MATFLALRGGKRIDLRIISEKGVQNGITARSWHTAKTHGSLPSPAMLLHRMPYPKGASLNPVQAAR